jgi:hypothetical protein
MYINKQYSSASDRVANESNVTPGEYVLESDTGNVYQRTTTDWLWISTSGVPHVLLKNTSIVMQGIGDGGIFNFSAASGEVGRTGDLSIFGLPYGDVLLTKTGTTAIATVTWAVGSGGLVVFDITALNAADAINITAENTNGSPMTNILYRTAAGAISRAALNAATMVTLYNGGA